MNIGSVFTNVYIIFQILKKVLANDAQDGLVYTSFSPEYGKSF